MKSQRPILEGRTGEFGTTEVAFCSLLLQPRLSYQQGPGDQHQRVSKSAFSLFCELLLSFCFQFCNTELAHFLAGMQLVLYPMFEEKAGKCKLPEVILLLRC